MNSEQKRFRETIKSLNSMEPKKLECKKISPEEERILWERCNKKIEQIEVEQSRAKRRLNKEDPIL